MADLTISPDAIRDALKDFVASYEPASASATEVGTVVDAADGIAHVEGLPGVGGDPIECGHLVQVVVG